MLLSGSVPTVLFFPPALAFFNIDPHRIIFLDLRNQKDVAWAVEESLKLNGLAAVIGEMRDLDFTTSRRLQLAVEKSQVTGLLINSSKKITIQMPVFAVGRSRLRPV